MNARSRTRPAPNPDRAICPKLTAGWKTRRFRMSSGTRGPAAATSVIPKTALPLSIANTTPAVKIAITEELMNIRSFTSTDSNDSTTKTTAKITQLIHGGDAPMRPATTSAASPAVR